MNDHEYTARDLARHVLTEEQSKPFCEEGKAQAMTVAMVIVEANLVGYGGHFDELMPDEENDLWSLAEIVAPFYQMSDERAYELLVQIWHAYTKDLTEAMVLINHRWRVGRYDTVEYGS